MNRAAYRWVCAFTCLALTAGLLAGCRQQKTESDVGSSSVASGTSSMQQGEYTDMSEAKIIKTVYPTVDVVVADLVATEAPYEADPTGEKDSTQAIQSALNACAAKGGGTVFLPVGKYRLTKSLTIPAFVTLRGDWQDPDEGQEYGTILLAEVESTEADLPALLTLQGSAGAYGLTIYYPQQSIDSVKPYPFTFYVGGAMLQSIINCTVLNGYRGVGANTVSGVHEMMSVDTLKGTFLKSGAEAYNQADVGTWKNVVLSNTYWADAGAGLASAALDKINRYTEANGTGLILGDLEWTQLTNIKLSHYKTGVRIVKGKRIEFAGSFYDLTVTDCEVGLQVDAIDTRWGMLVGNSLIEGSRYAVVNQTEGLVKMAGTQVKGAVQGDNIKQEHDAVSAARPEYRMAQSKPKDALYNVISAAYRADRTGGSDTSAAIQKALDDAGAAGGGVVYLPAGDYRLEAPLTVPAGVELRGCSSVPVRDQGKGGSKGTKLHSLYGRMTEGADTAQALVTLNGDRAGISGLRILYPANSPQGEGRKAEVEAYAFAVRGKGKEVYAVNLALVAAYYGIDFDGCDGHFIKKVVTGCYKTGFRLSNSTGGFVEGCLQNGTVVTRVDASVLRKAAPEAPAWIDEGKIFENLLNPVTRKLTTLFELNSVTGQTILNCFAYGVNTYFDADGSEVNIVNIGADNLYETGTYLQTKGGSVSVTNMMRYNGRSYRNDKENPAALFLYNRLTINDKTEKDVLPG